LLSPILFVLFMYIPIDDPQRVLEENWT
jgi:hypothetical protein